MGKKILVIGGTYFAGRVFAIIGSRKGYELTFLNRGRFSMKYLGETVREVKADRTDPVSLKNCGVEGRFDAVVDFCAYEPLDIRKVLENLSVSTKKYIYMSTADVYKRTGAVLNEECERQDTRPEDPVGLYTYKKKLLEDELAEAAKEQGFAYTILRPAFIYGPYNYAPRESVYIRNLIRKEPVYQPTDASGSFQMAYVTDVAEIISACIENDAADNRAFNVSAPEVLDYGKFLTVLEKVSGLKAENLVPVTVRDVIARNIPLPFPLTEAESERFDGSLVCKELGVTYTDIETGMKKTFDAFRPVYEQQ